MTVKTIEACIDDVEYALRLLQKAAVARQARVAGQKPGGLCRAVRNEGVGGASQSSGTVSEVREKRRERGRGRRKSLESA